MHVISSLVNRRCIHIPVDRRLHLIGVSLSINRRGWTSIDWRLGIGIRRSIARRCIHIGSGRECCFINRHAAYSWSISHVFRCPSSLIRIWCTFYVWCHSTCVYIANFFRHERSCTLKFFKIVLNSSLSFFINQLSVEDYIKTTSTNGSKLSHDDILCDSK